MGSAVRGGALLVQLRTHDSSQAELEVSGLPMSQASGLTFSLYLPESERGAVVVDSDTLTSSNVPVCVSWVSARTEWSSSGCSTSFAPVNDMITCTCSELAMFAVRMTSGVKCGEPGGVPCRLSTPEETPEPDSGRGILIAGIVSGVVAVALVVVGYTIVKRRKKAARLGQRHQAAMYGSRAQSPEGSPAGAPGATAVVVEGDFVHMSPSAVAGVDSEVNPTPPVGWDVHRGGRSLGLTRGKGVA